MLDALRPRLVAADDAATRFADASAAVAVLLRERPGAEVLVTERARRESDPWSGQWSFPGGRRQPGEPLLHAAWRETEEEVGLPLRDRSPLGCLPARSPRNRPGLVVLPFVFAWDGPEEAHARAEVDAVAWVPLAGLPSTRTTARITVRDLELEMPAFVEGRRTIWGFTYRVLEELLPLLPADA